MNAVAKRAARRSATRAASSTVAPSAMASTAAQAQHVTPKLAVDVSTKRTGTGTALDATLAEFNVPLNAAPMWTDRICVEPATTRRS